MQSVRGVTVSESSSRASLYMTILSSALIAYGFLAETDVAPAYLGVVLPIVFLLGIFTWERLVRTSLEDILAVGAIQRIRRYYATLLPGAEHFFPQPTDRTAGNELLDIGAPSSSRGVVFTTSSAILTVNCIVGSTGIAAGSVRSRPRGSRIHCDWRPGRTCLVHRPRLVPAATVQAGQGGRRARVVTIAAGLPRRPNAGTHARLQRRGPCEWRPSTA